MSVMIGAFIFGIGMQLGGGCASGTLYTVGAGSAHMIVTLFFFCTGFSLWRFHIFRWWLILPHFETNYFRTKTRSRASFVYFNLVLFAAIAAATVYLIKNVTAVSKLNHEVQNQGCKRYSAWPMAFGLGVASVLTLLNFADLWRWLAAQSGCNLSTGCLGC